MENYQLLIGWATDESGWAWAHPGPPVATRLPQTYEWSNHFWSWDWLLHKGYMQCVRIWPKQSILGSRVIKMPTFWNRFCVRRVHMMPKCCIRRQFTRFWKRASVSTLQPSVVCHVTNVVFLFCNLVNLLHHIPTP